jgi:ubiquinone/menaquinone biosynthesis C-methylase UbiE
VVVVTQTNISPRSINDLLAWSDSDLPRVQYLLALRRFWMGPLYHALRRQYVTATAAGPAPATAAQAMPIVDTLPGTRYFTWLDRHIQDSMWLEASRMVDDRLEEITDSLEPRPDDLGTLTELPAGTPLPAYYTDTDFHRQRGGIWADPRGAAIYALGARIVHVGRNDNYEIHDAFAAAIPDNAPADVLDLGCGFGKTTFSLAKRWPDANVHGVDLSAPCLRLGRRLATESGLAIHWQQGDAEHLPYAAGQFDLVTATMVLHELPSKSLHAVLREAHRVLRPGGMLAVLDNRTLNDPLRDVLAGYHSDVIEEVFMNDFWSSDLAGHARAAGFHATAEPWHAPGIRPGAEHDPHRWVTPWALLVASKEG